MHLNERQILEILEGREPDGVPGHLAGCPECRNEVDRLRAVLAAVSAVEVPEPSPLFWTHFRTRITEATDKSLPAAADASPWRFRWLAAATAVCCALLIVFASRTPREIGAPMQVQVASGAPAIVLTESDVSGDDIEADEAWAIVRSVADDIDYETARDAGLSPAPGALDRAAVTLSAAEQAALVTLLEQEMKRTDS